MCVHLQLQGRLAESQTRLVRLVFWVSTQRPVAKKEAFPREDLKSEASYTVCAMEGGRGMSELQFLT